MTSVSIYFFGGDFTDVLRRFQEGRQQIYQTHNEVARLIHDLLTAKQTVNVYSFITPERRVDRPINGCRVVSLGASSYAARSLLGAAAAEDDADAIVAHFPNLELLRAAVATKSRVIAVLANSYNRTGIRSRYEKWKVVSALNNRQIELVSNHCMPATRQLARMGVTREKLIAWDIAHPFNPSEFKPKELTARQSFEAVYVGSIIEGKGVGDLIRAIALLRQQGIEVHCSLAGLGDIDAMQALGSALGVSDLLSFLRIIGNTEAFNMMVAADLVAVPSRTEYTEGFPLTMFEAIASRTPIVCSDHPMFRDLMIDGRNASTFPAANHQALAAAVKRTLTDPLLYSTLSANAEKTWVALQGPADWRTLMFKWIVEGSSSPWIRERMLSAVSPSREHDRTLE
jgi:glycosyltransferase involved in cell wall biosynthesis